MKKLVFFAVLCVALAGFSHGETYLALEGGFYSLSDEFTNDDYGRNLNGQTYNLSVTHFPGTFPLGVLARISSGNLDSGFEWTGSNEMSAVEASSMGNLRIAVAPVFQFQLSPKVKIPVSLGPVFSFYTEKTWSTWDSDGNKVSGDTYYEALNLGLMTDAALVVNIVRMLYLKSGVMLEWDFLRAEKGEMKMNYRSFRSARYTGVPYTGGALTLYLGIGLMFK